jgi:hypothetical protein
MSHSKALALPPVLLDIEDDDSDDLPLIQEEVRHP